MVVCFVSLIKLWGIVSKQSNLNIGYKMETYEELDKIFEAADNPLEAFIAALIYMVVRLIFRVVEVVVDYGTYQERT